MTLPARLQLLVLGVLIGAGLVIASEYVIGLMLHEGHGLDAARSADAWAMQWLLASLAMAVLALFGQRRAFWIAAVLSSMMWSYVVFQTWSDHRKAAVTGANIGLGIIMLASPFFILALALVADRLTAPRRNRG